MVKEFNFLRLYLGNVVYTDWRLRDNDTEKTQQLKVQNKIHNKLILKNEIQIIVIKL